MSLPSKQILAALFAQVMMRRYETQDFSEGNREDYVRVAMEGDPVVYLEAAWDWFRHGVKNFRPSPGELRAMTNGWAVEDKPFVTLHRAIELAAGGSTDPGLHALIARFGPAKFAAAGESLMPSHITAWKEANLEHRVFLVAKGRMLERNAPPWNPSEGKGLALEGVRDALSLPAAKAEHITHTLAEGLANTKRISS